MKDIIISVDSTSHKVNFPDEFLGIGYENLQGNLIFQFDNNFIGGQARLDISIDCESGMIPNLTPYENGYILPIKSSLLTGSNVLMQLVIDETSLTQYSLTTDTEINPNKTYYEKVGNDYIIVENPVVGDISQYYEANTPVFKTDIFQLKVKDSINAQETIPEQYPTWINTLNTLIGTINQKLGLVDTALTEMNNLNINVSDKVDGEVTITFTDKQGIQKEVKINDGRGIVSILKTATSGNIDTYTITYTDNTTSTFEVTNGIDGTDGRGIVSIEKTGTTGLIDTYTITYTDNTTSTFNVENGRGITNIEKINTDLLVDTYRISFNDGTTQDYEVTNGKGIVSIGKTSTEGLTDIYTITYNDETTATFNVVNGKGIVSIEKTSTSGYVDTYTITYNDGTTSTYEVTNGEVSQAQLDALQDELNYYKTIVNALPKITGSGTSITLNNTADSILSNVLNPSELSQDGTPTPETPYDIHTISGDNTIEVVGNNLLPNQSQSPEVNLGVENLLPFEVGYKETKNGVTLEVKNDGIYLNGAPNISSGYIAFNYNISLDTDYYTSFFPENMVGLGVQFPNGGLNFNMGDTTPTIRSTNISSITSGIGSINVRYDIGTLNNKKITPMLLKGNYTKQISYSPYGQTPIQYCKIGNYADIFFKNEISSPLYNATLELDKWYLKKNIGKVVLDGSDTGIQSISSYDQVLSYIGEGVSFQASFINLLTAKSSTEYLVISNYFDKAILNDKITKTNIIYSYVDGILRIATNITNKPDFKAWLSTHNTIVYYVLLTPTYILLNDTLQSQLEYIYNQMLAYKGQTNISQINNDLPFIIDSTALKDLTSL